jgi:hypothetical protein
MAGRNKIYIKIAAKDLASFQTNTESRVTEKGNCDLKIGAYSTNIKRTGSFSVRKDLVIEKVHKSVSSLVPIDELTR